MDDTQFIKVYGPVPRFPHVAIYRLDGKKDDHLDRPLLARHTLDFPVPLRTKGTVCRWGERGSTSSGDCQSDTLTTRVRRVCVRINTLKGHPGRSSNDTGV
ncbi:hypothetical protein E2C01_007265 [Portunus trituberculatus]|uniref:Uncharacterized protein n=1 Tax=Portunus trituberculatus TaxID=210409 RepID=A0A5B7CYZ5_PORTR|nr:hypothetical protein [Portunus trituberculatus]